MVREINSPNSYIQALISLILSEYILEKHNLDPNCIFFRLYDLKKGKQEHPKTRRVERYGAL